MFAVARPDEFAAGQPRNDELNDSDKAILDFASKRYNYRGKQEQDIHEQFGLSGTSFWMKVNRIIDDPNAMKHDAQTVNRYRRIREAGRDRKAQRWENAQ